MCLLSRSFFIFYEGSSNGFWDQGLRVSRATGSSSEALLPQRSASGLDFRLQGSSTGSSKGFRVLKGFFQGFRVTSLKVSFPGLPVLDRFVYKGLRPHHGFWNGFRVPWF